jgi:hypothetical protein
MNAYLIHIIIENHNKRMRENPIESYCVVNKFLDYTGDNMRKVVLHIAKSWWGQI